MTIMTDNTELQTQAMDMETKNRQFEEDLEELPDDTFYIRDLIGLEVIDDSGRIGVIKDVLQPSSQDVYVIQTDKNQDIMIPAVKEFVKEVNLEEKYIKVSLIEGMLEQ